MKAQKLYKQILTEVNSGQKILAVFDLDSTLYDVSPRTERILKEFSELNTHQVNFAKSMEILKNVKLNRQDWGYQEALKRISDFEHSPEFYDLIQRHWVQHFFANDHLKYDQPYPGAVDFVNNLHQNKVEVAYLTGRDRPRMGSGTEEVLKGSGFPLDVRATLHLKSDKSHDDAQFKNDWFANEVARHDKVYFFENEPLNIDLVTQNFPQVNIVFFASTHSGKLPSPTQFLTLEDYLL